MADSMAASRMIDSTVGEVELRWPLLDPFMFQLRLGLWRLRAVCYLKPIDWCEINCSCAAIDIDEKNFSDFSESEQLDWMLNGSFAGGVSKCRFELLVVEFRNKKMRGVSARVVFCSNSYVYLCSVENSISRQNDKISVSESPLSTPPTTPLLVTAPYKNWQHLERDPNAVLTIGWHIQAKIFWWYR